MNIFVAGGTGVLGRATVRALVEAGHRVRSTARGAANTALIRGIGAQPVDVDLYDADAIRRAVAGLDAVLRLTTKIPPLAMMRRRRAWTETNRLRTVSARLLVDAAITERIPLYVHESVTFVYADGGTRWLDEDAPTDDGGTTMLRAALEGEREAARFRQSGGRGVVLRFGAFYSPDAPSTIETEGLARRRMLPQIGSGAHYLSSIYVPDAARAVGAALGVPAGIYNVCDDAPVLFAEYLRILATALKAPRPFHLPGALGRWIFGDVWSFFSRSQRVSNARFKHTSGWAPQVRSISEGWPLTVARVTAPERS